MKRWIHSSQQIRSSRNISQKYVYTPQEMIKRELGILSYGSDFNLSPVKDGKYNFSISSRYGSLDKSSDIVDDLKALGAKYITPRYGKIYFFFDTSEFEDEYNKAKQAAAEDYANQLSAFDISQYKPDSKTLDKLMAYRSKGSNVNVKAIKDVNKLLTYYYAAKLLGWNELANSISQIASFDYSDELQSIAKQVSPDPAYADERQPEDIELGIKDSKGLFTFDQRTSSGRRVSCWLPKKLLEHLIDNNIPVHFGKRTSGSHFDRNGRQWTEIEHLTFFPGTDKQRNFQIAVHTDEGGGTTTYTAQNSSNERGSASTLIKDVDRFLNDPNY